jgi:competence/damage-inducible protein CinA-like protein
MNISIIAVGNEVLFGVIKNTTTPWLLSSLVSIGHEPVITTIVPDSISKIHDALDISLKASDMVILTGGLGPTPDDLTKNAVAGYLGLSMVHSKIAEKMIRDFFKRRDIHMPVSNLNQAMIPKGSELLKNIVGTAPGIRILSGNKTIILLPGPPRELEPMWNNEVLPTLKTNSKLSTKDFFVLGMSESKMTDILGSILSNTNEPTVAPYASLGQIRLRISSHANNFEDFENKISQLQNKLETLLKGFLFSKPAPVALTEILKKNNLTISTAESCTGGLIAKTLTDIPGVSATFMGSAVAYSNQAKMDVLGVSEKTLEQFGAVSPEVAHEMAEGSRKVFKSDIAISSTGIAGPTGGTDEKPVGLVYMGVSTPEKTEIFKEVFHGNRADIRQMTMMRTFWKIIEMLSEVEE